MNADAVVLPVDVAPAVVRPGLGLVECYPCPRFECWHPRASDSCGLGFGVHTWVDATGTTIIRPPRLCREVVGEGIYGSSFSSFVKGSPEGGSP